MQTIYGHVNVPTAGGRVGFFGVNIGGHCSQDDLEGDPGAPGNVPPLLCGLFLVCSVPSLLLSSLFCHSFFFCSLLNCVQCKHF